MKLQEQQLRNTIIHYHKRMFPEVNIDSENENSSNVDNNQQSQKPIDDTFEDDFSSRLNLADTSIKNVDFNNNYENLVLDENFMNNYEAWLNQEVWQNSDDDELNDEKTSIEDLHLSNSRIFSNLASFDSSIFGSNSFFSATKKINKDIFGYNINTNDIEWYNEEEEDNDDNLSSASENDMGWDYPLDENDEVWK